MSEDESDVDLDPAHQLVRLRRRLPAFKQRPPPSSDDSDASEDPLPDGYCHRKSSLANSCWTISDLSRLDDSGPLSPAAKTGYMCEVCVYMPVCARWSLCSPHNSFSLLFPLVATATPVPSPPASFNREFLILSPSGRVPELA